MKLVDRLANGLEGQLANSRAYLKVELEQLDKAAAAVGGTLEWSAGYVGEYHAELRGHFVIQRLNLNANESVSRFYVDLQRRLGAGSKAELRVGGYTPGRFPVYNPGKAEAVFRRRVHAFERRLGVRVSHRPQFQAVQKVRAPGHRNACAVIALAAVAGCTIEDAHAFFELYGARPTRFSGTASLCGFCAADPTSKDLSFNLNLLGVRMEHLEGVNNMSAARLVREWGPKARRVYIHVSGHAAAMVDGVVFDTGALRPRSRVENAWVVVDLEGKHNAEAMQ